MNKVSFWRRFEEIAGLLAVPARWAIGLEQEFPAFKTRLLSSLGQFAKSFPCRRCGCAHEVIQHEDSSLVAVCRCKPWNCSDIKITQPDISLLEFNWSKSGREIAKAFDFDFKDSNYGIGGTRQIGSFGAAALPIVLTIQHDEGWFRVAISQLVAMLQKPFILLAPTSQFIEGNSLGMLASVKAGFFDLESNITLTPSGVLHAPKKAGELFSPYLVEQTEPANENEAVRLFALVKQLESEAGWRKAPVLQVFRLYCMENLSRGEVAKRCGCAPSLVTLRLKAIEKKLGRKPSELRQYSSHFESMQESVSDSRAKRIHRSAGG